MKLPTVTSQLASLGPRFRPTLNRTLPAGTGITSGQFFRRVTSDIPVVLTRIVDTYRDGTPREVEIRLPEGSEWRTRYELLCLPGRTVESDRRMARMLEKANDSLMTVRAGSIADATEEQAWSAYERGEEVEIY